MLEVIVFTDLLDHHFPDDVGCLVVIMRVFLHEAEAVDVHDETPPVSRPEDVKTTDELREDYTDAHRHLALNIGQACLLAHLLASNWVSVHDPIDVWRLPEFTEVVVRIDRVNF